MGLKYFEKYEKKFSSQLLKEVTSKNSIENVIISPLTARSSLAMLLMGACNKTSEELRMLLGLHPKYPKREVARLFRSIFSNLSSFDLQIHQKIFSHVEFDVKPVVDHFLEKYFNSPIGQVCFGNLEIVKMTIDSYVSNGTENAVRNLSTKVRPEERFLVVGVVSLELVLGNASELIKDASPKPFWVKENESILVPMLHSQGIYNYGEVFNASILELNLRNNLSLMIILPKAKMTIEKLLKNFNIFHTEEFSKKIKEIPLRFSIPEFEANFEYDLKNYLKKLGTATNVMKNPNFKDFFLQQHSPDVGSIIQKAQIIFDGKSDKTIQIDPNLFTTDTKIFIANRPFVFFVKHKISNTIILAGVINKPKTNACTQLIPVINEPKIPKIEKVIQNPPMPQTPILTKKFIPPMHMGALAPQPNFPCAPNPQMMMMSNMAANMNNQMQFLHPNQMMPLMSAGWRPMMQPGMPSPMITPIGTPMMTPMGSPMMTPMASPMMSAKFVRK